VYRVSEIVLKVYVRLSAVVIVPGLGILKVPAVTETTLPERIKLDDGSPIRIIGFTKRTASAALPMNIVFEGAS
jgi:hypothetical protein